MTGTLLKLPLDPHLLPDLKIGQWVNFSGSLYTARDAALKRVAELMADNRQPPVDFKGQLVYFVGPTPPAPGHALGAAGPTTSRRMEKYIPSLLDAGTVAVMGKGPLTAEMKSQFQRRNAVYFSAAGGCGAFYGSKIHGAALVAYHDLGPEAIYCLHVENFPAVVAFDLEGRDLFEDGPKAYRKA